MNDDNANSVDVCVLRTEDEFRTLEQRWSALLESSPSKNFFLRWDWLWEWWQAYSTEDHTLCIILVHDKSGLIGIAPFYRLNRQWKNIFTYRTLLFIGTTEESLISEYMDIISAEGLASVVVRAVIDKVVRDDMADELFLQKIDMSSESMPVLRECADGHGMMYEESEPQECPHVELTGTYDGFIKGLGASTRAKIRRDSRRLEQYDKVRFRRTEGSDELDSDFSEFIRLHTLRWNRRAEPGSFATGNFEGLLRSVARRLIGTGELDLMFLEVSGRAVASLFNLIDDKRIYFLQSGLDTELAPGLSPGLLLHDYSIRRAIESGMEEYDLLMMGSTDGYKKRLSNGSRYLCDIRLTRPGIMKKMRRAGAISRRLKKSLKHGDR